jgi:uncharacterized protein (UPF0305 family)
MPPHNRSKQNVTAETEQEEHHHVKGNEISLALEPSHITDQERRARLEALMKARAERTTHIQEQPTEQQTHENDDDDDDETVDKELKEFNRKYSSCKKRKKNSQANCKQKKGL